MNSVFLLGLVAAEAACGGATSPPPDVNRRPPSNPMSRRPGHYAVDRAPEKDRAEAKADAATFRAVDWRAAPIAGIEVLGFAERIGDTVMCDPEPCPPEFTKASERIGPRVLVGRRGGEVRAFYSDELREAFGGVDTPEKAAILASLAASSGLALCSDFGSLDASCTEGSVADGTPVRAADGGFDVALFGETNVCTDHMFGQGNAFSVVHVANSGEASGVASPLSELSKQLARLENVECKVPFLGRMFEGYVDIPAAECELDYYVRAHRQESAAVIAFERLAAELRSYGAPADLVRAALRSAEEERNHAALFLREAQALASELGSPLALREPEAPPRFEARSLFDFLLENAAEGCANEAFSAVIATYQSIHAKKASVRAVFEQIAADERDHAALAYRIYAWGRSAVGEPERALLDAAYFSALARMRTAEITPQGRAMGEPPRERAVAAFDAVSRALLWAVDAPAA